MKGLWGRKGGSERNGGRGSRYHTHTHDTHTHTVGREQIGKQTERRREVLERIELAKVNSMTKP